MDPYDFPVTRSPRKELQGPRPPALKVRKDSHKIRKPPVAPQSQQQQYQNQNQPQTQLRPPVIIYTVSPKVIHTNPNDFMNLVQRLTGSSSSSAATSNSTATTTANNNYNNPFNNDYGGAVSPAARYATMEKAKSSPKDKMKLGDEDMGFFEGIEMSQVMERSSLNNNSNLFPGILSPAPASLPPISPNYFSPVIPSDPNMLSFLHDLSPVVHGNRSFLEGSFMPSPSTNFFSPRLTATAFPSPASMELFNNFGNIFDF
ncbi:nuclear speckle RNA-binding protein B [Mercurialis annua]|uniref:nuclear speckle RNA-binding protein B n=1 Tax=Mercurialis annua TaxID=3986 RepID=UPI00215EE105|nr:nuclear speckle RNA-binding protein B [Mercurialis annua]